MLQGETTLFAIECAGYNLDRNVSRNTLLGISASEHFALAGSLQIAVDLLVDRKAGKSFGRRGREGFDINAECAFCGQV